MILIVAGVTRGVAAEEGMSLLSAPSARQGGQLKSPYTDAASVAEESHKI
jgi:hypothetical protein